MHVLRARRDGRKARAKERVFSVRDDFGQWNEKLQRLNYLTCLTVTFTMVKMFPLVIGLYWTYGITSKEGFIMLINERSLTWMPYSDFIQVRESDEIITANFVFEQLEMTCTASIVRCLRTRQHHT